MKAEFSEKGPTYCNSGSSVNRPSEGSHGVFRTIFNDQSGGHPIRTDDHLVMVKIEDLILADIDKNLLTIYTVDGIYKTKETLINFQNRINRRNFIQISRHSIINIDHLESLSDSFSGNMMAKMTRGIKSSVSRKYVKSLMNYLGL